MRRDIPHGAAVFVFEGKKAGAVELTFTRSEPKTTEVVKLEVFADLRIANLSPGVNIPVSEELISLALPANAADEKAWSYTVVSGTGRLKESTPEAYEEYLIAREGGGGDIIVEPFVPGTRPFIFEGTKSGAVTLKFKYAKSNETPEMMQIVSFMIYEDNTLAVTENYAAAMNQNYAAVFLPADIMSGGKWTFKAKGAGKVTEAAWEDYQEQELAASEADEDIIIIPIIVPPGSTVFVFKGAKAGVAELTFTLSEPKEERTVFIEVFPDMTVAAIWPEDE